MQGVAVWGACGFIGGHLVSALLERGIRVTAVVRQRSMYPAPAWASDVEWVEVGPSGSNRQAFSDVWRNNDVIFNLAGTSGAVASNRDPRTSLQSNCAAQLDFLESCPLDGKLGHVVFASSRLVYGRPQSIPVDEDHPLRPLSIYAIHKLCVEHYHQLYAARRGMTYTICRMANPYGFDSAVGGKSYGIINRFIMQGVRGEPITLFGDGRQLRDYIHISDLTDGLLHCGLRPEARNQIFNLGLGSGITMYDAACEIQKATGAPEVRVLPWPPEYDAVESGDFVSDIGRVQALLNFRPRLDFARGLALTIPPYVHEHGRAPLTTADPITAALRAGAG